MAVIFDVEFAFTEGVPQFDRTITGARDDLPVVSTEADRQNVGSVSNKFTGGLAGVQVPQTECVIPRR